MRISDGLGRLVRPLLAQVQGRRRKVVLHRVTGRLLDVGCGANRLVREYGNGVGVDVVDWGDVDMLIEDASRLPFPDDSFDTVSFVACLNHIPTRASALSEARRVLRPKGRLLITMIPPGISRVWHWLIAPWDADQHHRHIGPGEVWGLSAAQVGSLLTEAGFVLVERRRFDLGINNLYVARKGELAS